MLAGGCLKIKVVKVDYTSPKQAHALTFLLNAYAMDPMGGGQPLAEGVMGNLPQALAKLPNAFSFIAYVDDQPAGLINCFEGFSTFSCKALLNIHDVAVLQPFRGLGISHKMLAEVEALATKRGCCKLTLEVLSGNPVARSAYEKFGFFAYELNPAAGQALFLEKTIIDG